MSGINDDITTISSLVLMREHIKFFTLINSLENIARIVFGIVANPILLIGVFSALAASLVWSRKRWRRPFGLVQLFIACYSALALIMAFSTPSKVFFETPPEGYDRIVVIMGYFIFSASALFFGVLLIIKQKRQDSKT